MDTVAPIVLAATAFVATAAAVADLKWRRIPNWLNGAALLTGFVANWWLAGTAGLLTAIAGAGLGFALLLPFYMLRGVGAGDVKLLAAIGALVGPHMVVWVALFGGLIGGAMSLVVLASSGRLRPMLGQLFTLRTIPVGSGLKAPYGVAIAGGVYAALAVGALT
jgi:prepilin peptidase CpaA